MAYLLDSNVFIEAKSHYYGFRLCPGFWEWLSLAHEQKTAFSVKQVLNELIGRGDLLSIWCKSRGKMFMDTSDSQSFDSFKLLATWVSSNYSNAQRNRFLSGADFSLVGYAHAHGHTVVTTEIATKGGLQVKIPNACKEMNVPWMTPFKMLAAEKVAFHLSH